MASSRLKCPSSIVLLGLAIAGGVCANEPDATSTASQWAQFRGPNSGGIAAEQETIPLEFGPEKNVVWKTPLPSGAGSPCIWEDRVFVTAFDQDEKKLELISIDRTDGTILWRRDVKAKQIEKVHAASTPASSTPATDGQHVYAYFGSRGLLCYDYEGQLVWSIDLPLPNMRNGSGTSPIVVGDVVLLNRDQLRDPQLLAVNKLNGEVVWKHPHLFGGGIMSEGYATPILWKDQIIVHTHEGIRAISLSDGQMIWRANTSTTGCSTPIVSGSKLYVATWNNLGEPALRTEIPNFEKLLDHDVDENKTISFQEFPRKLKLFDRPEAKGEKSVSAPLAMVLGMADANRDKEIDSKEWEAFQQGFKSFISDHGLLAIELGGSGDVTDTHVTVLQTKNIPEVPSPLAHHGRIYIVKNGGIVSCFNESTGERLFTKRISASGSYYASPVAVGDKVVLASTKGETTILRSADTLEVIAVNDLGERILSTPAVVDNTLYVRTNENLYAFAESTKLP